MTNYFFIPRQFNVYARHAADILELRGVCAPEANVALNNLLGAWCESSTSVCERMHAFNKRTKNFGGWVKSFLPGTCAFIERAHLAKKFKTLEDIYFSIYIKVQALKMPELGKTLPTVKSHRGFKNNCKSSSREIVSHLTKVSSQTWDMASYSRRLF